MRGARRGENRTGARTASSPGQWRLGRKARIAPCGRRYLEGTPEDQNRRIQHSLEYVSSQSYTNAEHFIGMSQCLTCSCREVPVSGNKVHSLAKIVNIEIKESKTAILFRDSSHLSSHLSVDAHSTMV